MERQKANNEILINFQSLCKLYIDCPNLLRESCKREFELQSVLPNEMGVINRYQTRLQYLASTEDYGKTKKLSQEILTVMRAKKPLSNITSKSKNSPLFKEVLRDAEDNRAVSLVYTLDNRSLELARYRDKNSRRSRLRKDRPPPQNSLCLTR